MHLLLVPLVLCAAIDRDPQFKTAQKHVDAFEFEKAVSVLEEIAARPGLEPADKAQVLVWLGISYAELRDEARASIAFEEAVSADPLIVLPRDASPKIKALLDDARARVRLRPRKSAPEPAPTQPVAAPAEPPPAAEAPAASGGILFPAAVATAVIGGVAAVVGGAVWGVGLGLRQQAIDAEFQDDAAALRDQSVAAQVGGQIGVGVGVVVLAAGAVLLGVSFLE